MAQSIRTVGFSNSNQQLTWTAAYTVPVTAYMWGGGGGGGGNDSQLGGAGSGGAFSQISFFMSPGETITIAIGSAGRAGATTPGVGSAPGGSQGASYFNNFAGWWGGKGSAAGPVPWSGGGGGGGGATVLLKNNTVIAVAGGGGGGGGAGNFSGGENAPPGVISHRSIPSGGDGTPKGGDGGGAGGGGGGVQGGNGGSVPGGDVGGGAGSWGTSLGDIIALPTNRGAANNTNQYYIGSVGAGGVATSNGNAGYAVFVFEISGIHVHDDIAFRPVERVYVKQNNEWQQVRVTWLNRNGVWVPTDGSFAPTFSLVSGNYGVPGKVCVGVCDENDATSRDTMQADWNTFLSRYPSSVLYALDPGGSSGNSLRAPPNFNSSGQGFGPINVSRDNGRPSNASDWFAICNIASRPPGTIVEYSIDNSGSMTFETVAASTDLFLQQCAAGGYPVTYKGMSKENWIRPFL
jgi:hypothetical protein